MFIGHFAVGFAAKKITPSTPLPLLVAAAQLVDLVWPLFLLLGIESVAIDPGNTVVTPLDFISYPVTHSLLTAVLWGLGFGGVVYIFRKQAREMWVLAACVASHWILDLLTHRPDLPLVPWGDMKVGLGLWNSLAGTIVLEFGLFAAGVYMYWSALTAHGNKVSWAFWSFAGFLIVMHIGNLFGPPPPSVSMIAVAGNAMWLFVLWAWWSERGLQTPGMQASTA